MKRFYIVLSTQCENACFNCCVPLDIVRERRIVGIEDLQRIMRKYHIGPRDVVELTGGEPTLDHQLFLASLRYLVRDRGFQPEFVNVLTHGHEFEDRDFAEQASQYCGHVSSTFYSINAATHDQQTQRPGLYEKKLVGLTYLRELGVQLHIKYLLMAENYRQIPEFVDFCADKFPEAIVVFALLDYSGAAWENRDELKVRMLDVQPYLAEGIDRAVELGIQTNVLFPMCMIDPCRWEHVLSRDWTTTELEKVIFIEPEGDEILEVEQAWPDVRFQEKPTLCDGCALFNRCVWEWGGYEQLFPLDDEIRPYGTEESLSGT